MLKQLTQFVVGAQVDAKCITSQHSIINQEKTVVKLQDEYIIHLVSYDKFWHFLLILSTVNIQENYRNAMGKCGKLYTDRKNVFNYLYLVLHLALKVTCYFRLFSSVLVSVLRTSINVLSKSKSRNYVTWIANLTKLFLSVYYF